MICPSSLEDVGRPGLRKRRHIPFGGAHPPPKIILRLDPCATRYDALSAPIPRGESDGPELRVGLVKLEGR